MVFKTVELIVKEIECGPTRYSTDSKLLPVLNHKMGIEVGIHIEGVYV